MEATIKTKSSIKLWLPAIFWVIFILVLSTITVPEFDVPDIFFSVDKIAHFLVYGILSLLIILPLRFRTKPASPFKAIIIALTFSAAYGIIIEVYQKFVGRFMEFYDALANVIGSVLACLVYLAVYSVMEKIKGTTNEQGKYKTED